MRHLHIICAALLICCGCHHSLTSYVNPLVGTDGHGHTYPAAIVPFGMIQPGPDTRLCGWDGCSGYHYSDDTIFGFSHTHLSGTGCEDFGDLLLMPFAGDQTFGDRVIDRAEYLSTFSHNEEVAHPGYYRVKLERNDVTVELTCDPRVAYHRYSSSKHAVKGFIIDLHHRDQLLSGLIAQVGDSLIIGHRESAAWNPDQKLFFAIQTPIEHIEYRNDSSQAIVYLPENQNVIELKVAISAVDERGALANLATSRLSFDEAQKAADSLWEKHLQTIEIEGGSKTQRRTFYTALYHCFTAPYLFSDADGRYRGTDDSIHLAPGKDIYTVFSLWDTYRALHPLLTIIDRKHTSDFIYTFLQHYRQGGELTMWELAGNETHCMIGYHAAPVILEALRADLIDDSLMSPLLQAMTATSMRTDGQQRYAADGLLSSEYGSESVSRTLEYAYDDWCIASYAKLLMDRTSESLRIDSLSAIYQQYIRQSQSWKNLMDKEGFMHPRRNGGMLTPFDPTEVNNHFTEANSWQYSSYVPHDIYHWAECLGGDAIAIRFLDTLFYSNRNLTGRNQADITGLIGLYAHGNEPSHHTAFLYTYFGQPEKTNSLVHHILNTFYNDKADGLCGNEDCGQMSAWYVMSAMGFYPVCPGSGEYVTVEPLFDKVTIHLENGTSLVIDKKHWKSGMFWRPDMTHMTINGDDFHQRSCCGIDEKSRITPTPLFDNWSQRFEGAIDIVCSSGSGSPSGTRIFYTLDGSDPDTNALLYLQPIHADKDFSIKAIAFHPTTGYSHVSSHKLTQFVADKKISYITTPDPQYAAGGAELLIDRMFGSDDFRIGGWQGWAQDMEVVIDLLADKPIKSVAVNCLENIRSWIMYPQSIIVEYSHDGKEYQKFGHAATDLPKESRPAETHSFVVHGHASARYIRIKTKNYGALPKWHPSAGEQAWLFVDEISIN